MYISSEAWRADGRRPSFVLVFGESPDEPQVREPFDVPETVRVLKFFFKGIVCLESWDKPALPRDAELFGEVCVNMADGPYAQCAGGRAGCLFFCDNLILHK